MDKKELHRILDDGSYEIPKYTQTEMLDFIAPTVMRMLRCKKVDVAHRETCPVCGKQLVNLYRYRKEWLCRTCKIAAEKIDEEVHDDA